MKKKTTKRVVAALLVTCMALGVCTTGAMAARINQPEDVFIVPEEVNEEHAVAYDEFGFAEDGTYQPAELAKDSVYEISNVGQLYWFAQQVNSGNTDINGRIMADLDMSVTDIAWTPIGLGEEFAYTGWFDGGLFKITNMDGMLFGTTDGAMLENIAIESGVFYENGTAANATGSIVGVMRDSDLIQCYSKATINEHAFSNVGGLVGMAYGGRIENCFFAGSIHVMWQYGDWTVYVGGLVGGACELTVKNCFVNAAIDCERIELDQRYEELFGETYLFDQWMRNDAWIGGLIGAEYLRMNLDDKPTKIINSYYNCDLCGYTEIGNFAQIGIGFEPDPTYAKDTEFFASGELLNALTGGKNDILVVWGQDVEGGEAYPHLRTIGWWLEDIIHIVAQMPLF